MSPDPQVSLEQLEQTRKQINRLVEEIARLSEMDLAPTDYYGEFLQRVLQAVAAPAGAVWVRTPQGHLQLQYQVGVQQVGLDRSDTDRQTHDELLRLTAQTARPQMVPPHSGTGPTEDGKAAPGNPTDYVILMAPILVDKQVAGLVEVFQDADRNPQAQQGFLQFIVRMAELASSYTRNHQLRQMVGQQTLWTQLEAFARQIHGSLNPMEVGYVIANEGRRLVDCDRLSVALRRSTKKVAVEAVSGADVVEKRSNLIRLMSTLFEKVIKWGEKLIYRGEKDDSLPPDVIKALDAYLAESNSKLLVVLPLKDEREKESKKPPRSALLMECFDPAVAPEQLVARLEVVGRHATSALYNAAEHRRIPMRILWQPLAKVQEGLGGKAKAILASVGAGLLLLIGILVFVPYPLKMSATGQLLPKERRYVYSPVDAKILKFDVGPGDSVLEKTPLVELHDLKLEKDMLDLLAQIETAAAKEKALGAMFSKAKQEERLSISLEQVSEGSTVRLKTRELEALRLRVHAGDNPGYFFIKAPISGTVLNGSFVEELVGKSIKPNEPVLRIGFKEGRWEIEAKIEQKHIGQVLQAFKPEDGPNAELDVDIILKSAPTRTFKGRLMRKDVGGEATPNRDAHDETEPVVLAYIRIDGDFIDKDYLIPQTDNFLVTGTEVAVKIRCGNKRMGYSLFYGVWEFFYEKIVFAF